jgi:hypothetical protein
MSGSWSRLAPRRAAAAALSCALAVSLAASSATPTAAGPARIGQLDPWVLPDAEGKNVPGPADRVSILGLRNGIASAQVLVAGEAPLDGLSASVSDLTAAGGGAIPAARVQVRYPQMGARGFVPLLDAPTPGAKAQAVWLTVNVPADAKPGAYAGRVRIAGAGLSAEFPIELTVFGLTLRDPKDWRTVINVLQSPESVAGHYKVPLWSDEHFRLMEKSMELMALAGNDVLGVNAVGKSVFGDDPLILFRKEGGAYVPELKLLKRYLAQYHRLVGEPMFLALNVWSYGMYRSGLTRDGGDEEWSAKTIPVVTLEGDRLVPAEFPMYGEPGSEPLWRQVMDGVRACLRELGWARTQVLVGTSGDNWPGPATTKFFKAVAPDVQWRSLTHGGGCPKWGLTNQERTQPNGMTVGYLEIARLVPTRRLRPREHPITCNARDDVGSDPFTFRRLTNKLVLANGYDGVCWKGIDYWTFVTPEGTKRNALNSYVHFGNMVGGTPRTMAVAGPRGAVSTIQFEQFREGIQDCEAALSIRDTLERLFAPPKKTYDLMYLTLKGALIRTDYRDRGDPPYKYLRDLDLALCYRGNDKALESMTPSARSLNQGQHTCAFKALPAGDGQKYKVRVTINADQWVKGGEGDYVIEFKREGTVCRGTFAGTYAGVKVEGIIEGEFTPEGRSVTTGEPPPKTDLAKRCEAAVAELAEASVPRSVPSLRAALAKVYAAAAELAEAAAAKPPGAR